ncbi:hypothetical protein HBI56_074270 [Parastagonospora nodorum]|uniref:Uncharacterized protein n=2 Tax=Phaeosphaeria nodorum (strain SN15 / ATCC MYA-4574 / FGSC 10173) TaxID=321614 RepID=Q0UKK6_PHANO|nr:hypothetical protein SNOG_07708 [Parastagonospora nodorum SN15]KAH3908690.1 hypothetical protein HBH56_170710 [Parastagonospora nodorum]EAT85174.1 hypothetical protein SNOG_07708 [Parastagonospora nodorum SN15]KAH3928284.1 hypothetical protein HBH54_139270 [Parastagonospora nodorum]KAH3945380.1 hypothetical protein HBH53_144620 [Parastagonospora nodorum]KAH3983993.1 hypothetical protein HBH52_059600 [Parastagonospora nodorum]
MTFTILVRDGLPMLRLPMYANRLACNACHGSGESCSWAGRHELQICDNCIEFERVCLALGHKDRATIHFFSNEPEDMIADAQDQRGDAYKDWIKLCLKQIDRVGTFLENLAHPPEEKFAEMQDRLDAAKERRAADTTHLASVSAADVAADEDGESIDSDEACSVTDDDEMDSEDEAFCVEEDINLEIEIEVQSEDEDEDEDDVDAEGEGGMEE